MSLLINQTELLGKTIEELNSLHQEWNIKLDIVEVERRKHSMELSKIVSEKRDIESSLKQMLIEITKLEAIEDAKSILTQENNSIEGFELLREDELSIITKNMDKTDYRAYGAPRWLDLNTIIETVINMKKRYPTWILVDLSKCGQIDTMPPRTFYKYEYEDENKLNFNIGGIKVIR